MCLQGMRWSRADAMAGEIVTLALHRIGASHRPTWRAGQPEIREHEEFFWCKACGGYIEEGSSKPWCSAECNSTLIKRRWRSEIDERAREVAASLICGRDSPDDSSWREAERSCRRCGGLFTPTARRQRYCSRVCARQAGKLAPVACPICTTAFSPTNDQQAHCSVACTDEAARRRARAHLGERACSICSKPFAPFHGRQIYCGRSCQKEGTRRARGTASRRGDSRDCLICAEPFTSNGPALYCGPACIAEATRRHHSARRARLAIWHERNCQICDRPFKHRWKHVVRCSAACTQEADRRRSARKNAARREQRLTCEAEPVEASPQLLAEAA
jgi:hypothetical protein